MKTKRLESPSILATLALAGAALFFGTQTRAEAQGFPWMLDNVTWKYYQAGDEPADVGGLNWKELGYDDSSWGSGPAQLGFTEGDEATLLTRGKITYYFRHQLTVPQSQLDLYNSLVIEMIRDDGAVVYVNGVEHRRDNMPGSVGDPVAYSDLALAAVAGNDEKTYFKSTHQSDRGAFPTTGVFTAGANLVAVEIHQSNAGSSDISFQMRMLGFEVIPVLGEWIPPAPITFNEPLSFAGEEEYSPIPFPDDPFEIGWIMTQLSGQSRLHFVVPSLNAPADGFGYGNCVVANKGRVSIQTDVAGTGHSDEFHPGAFRINLANYKDVTVRFDLRAFDSVGIGMGTSEYARGYMYTSVDGGDFDETEMVNLIGEPSSSVTDPLVEEGDTKRLLVPTLADDNIIGTSWRDLGFDDSSWTSGTKGAGYERSSAGTYLPHFGFDELTMENQLFQTNGSLYLRIPFEVGANKDLYTGLILGVKYDDGYVAYINGHEVARKNASTTNWNSLASGDHADAQAVMFEQIAINEHRDKLVSGTNVLAIHGLNVSLTSSDMLTSAELFGVLPGGGGGIGEPTSLNDIVGPIDGPFHTFVRSVPDSAQTVYMKWELNASSGSNNAVMLDNVLVSGTPLEPLTYNDWIQLTTTYELDDLGEPNANPDGDELKNLLDYAFAGSATEPDINLVPTMSTIEIEGFLYFAMTWKQLNYTVSGTLEGPLVGGYTVRDITYIPQWSYDGIFWFDGNSGPTEFQLIDPDTLQLDPPLPEANGDTIEVTAIRTEAIGVVGNDGQPALAIPRIYGRVKVLLDSQ